MLTNERLTHFFTSSNHKDFSDIPTSLVTTRVEFEDDSEIDVGVLFENLPIYDIPGFVRGKNIEVKIPYPGIPYTILSAKLGSRVKGIVKDTNKLKKAKTNGRFSNRLSIDISVSDRVLNVMFFPSSFKITGGTCIRHPSEAFRFISRILEVLKSQGLQVCKKPIVATRICLDMENVSFDLGYKINLDSMEKYFKEHDKLASMPTEKEALRIEYPMGVNKAKGDPRYFLFRVRHTGKVMFSGDNRNHMEEFYNRFIEIVKAGESSFRFD
jgi:hypothetical protein